MNDDMGFDEKLKELYGALYDALSGMADKVNGALNSKGFQINARRVLAGRLREAAERPDLSWPVLCDVLCVSGRKEAVRALAAMVDPKYAPTEEERRILDMWPRYEDGERVWIGDAVKLDDGSDEVLYQVHIGETGYSLHTETHDEWHDPGDMVKRPAPKVLDADGVEIKVGDTVWHEDGSELHVIGFGDAQDGETMLVVEYAAGPTKWGEVRCLSVTHTRPAPKVLDADGVEIKVGDTVWDDDGIEMTVISLVGELPGHVTTHGDNPPAMHSISPKRLTHACPDSWERLEEDAVKVVCEYAGAVPDEFGDYDCDTCRLFDARGNLICEQQMALDIVRRAKAIAEVEVDG